MHRLGVIAPRQTEAVSFGSLDDGTRASAFHARPCRDGTSVVPHTFYFRRNPPTSGATCNKWLHGSLRKGRDTVEASSLPHVIDGSPLKWPRVTDQQEQCVVSVSLKERNLQSSIPKDVPHSHGIDASYYQQIAGCFLEKVSLPLS